MVLIGADEAFEADDGACGAQLRLLTTVLRHDLGRRALDLGGRHLAGDGALPDQVIEPCLITIEKALHVLGMAHEAGGADRLVSFLRVLRLGGISTRLLRHVARAEGLRDRRAGSIDGFRRHLHAVGSHVSDETDRLAADVHALVQALRDLHRAGRAEAELGGGRLLEARRGERRRKGCAWSAWPRRSQPGTRHRSACREWRKRALRC